MGENCEFLWATPIKYSFAERCGQNIDSVRLIQLRKSGASGRRRSVSARSKLPLDGFDPYVNCSKRSITTMPTIFRREVVDGVWVMGFFGCAGA
jgi:hypothetical protein